MRGAKVDLNQKAIVAALRGCGATVMHLHAVGKGCPDLAVGFRGATLLLEVKDGPKAKLTPAQEEWHAGWKGHAAVVTSVDDALAQLGITGTQGATA